MSIQLDGTKINKEPKVAELRKQVETLGDALENKIENLQREHDEYKSFITYATSKLRSALQDKKDASS